MLGKVMAESGLIASESEDMADNSLARDLD